VSEQVHRSERAFPHTNCSRRVRADPKLCVVNCLRLHMARTCCGVEAPDIDRGIRKHSIEAHRVLIYLHMWHTCCGAVAVDRGMRTHSIETHRVLMYVHVVSYLLRCCCGVVAVLLRCLLRCCCGVCCGVVAVFVSVLWLQT
jgi:hypothetical protein